MRRMSFALTTDQILNREKIVTRRNNWKFLKIGDKIQPIYKGMGLKKGEEQQLLGGPILITGVSVQRLYQIDQTDCILEGFPEMSPKEFIEMYCKANRCDRNRRVTRIQFEYL